jgi:manganese/zinc/iron transport system permease protein
VSIDIALMTLVALSVVIGLPAVGVVLMAALLILPGTAARFWTNQLSLMLITAGLFGFITALVGTAVSARFERLPAGPIIVLTGTALFLVSMAVAPRRGLVARGIRHLRFRRELADRAALQKLYEARRFEPAIASLSARTISRLRRRGLFEDLNGHNPRLTTAGQQRGARIVRGRKLWQLFLTEYPDLAPSMANLAEESVEGLVPDEVVAELVRKLEAAERTLVAGAPLEASHG